MADPRPITHQQAVSRARKARFHLLAAKANLMQIADFAEEHTGVEPINAEFLAVKVREALESLSDIFPGCTHAGYSDVGVVPEVCSVNPKEAANG